MNIIDLSTTAIITKLSGKLEGVVAVDIFDKMVKFYLEGEGKDKVVCCGSGSKKELIENCKKELGIEIDWEVDIEFGENNWERVDRVQEYLDDLMGIDESVSEELDEDYIELW